VDQVARTKGEELKRVCAMAKEGQLPQSFRKEVPSSHEIPHPSYLIDMPFRQLVTHDPHLMHTYEFKTQLLAYTRQKLIHVAMDPRHIEHSGISSGVTLELV
jgi:hypothetical protein